jgi:hypothetical protein
MALQIITEEDGTAHAGLLTPVALTADCAICGQGFNDKTVKVRLGNRYYVVFREHLKRSFGKAFWGEQHKVADLAGKASSS